MLMDKIGIKGTLYIDKLFTCDSLSDNGSYTLIYLNGHQLIELFGKDKEMWPC